MSTRYTNQKTKDIEHFAFVGDIPGISDFWNILKSIPGKIGDVFRSVFDGIKDGAENLMGEAMKRFLEAMTTMLKGVFGPIFNPLMPYIYALGIGTALLILTCIGAMIFIFTRPDKCSCTQSGGFNENNNMEIFNIIILILISIIIFSKKKLEHFGFIPGINTIIDPIKDIFFKIRDGIVSALGKVLNLIEENTIGKIETKINSMVSEIQVFLKPILIGGAVLLPLMCIGIIAFTFFFFGQDDKPEPAPEPTPKPAPKTTPTSAPKPMPMPTPKPMPVQLPVTIPVQTPVQTPVVFQGGKKYKK